MSRTVLSLFSGLGGLDLGFKYAGFDVVWANDFAVEAVKSYGLNFELTPVCASITELSHRDIPDADVIVGGPPCQSFSLVGQRDPADARGRLVFSFVDVVRQKKPAAFVMENVPGIQSSRVNGVRLTDVLVKSFEELGYKVSAASLVATDFGVPQLRRRVFIMGARDFHPAVPDGGRFLSEAYDGFHFGRTAQEALGDLGLCVPKGQPAVYNDNVAPSDFAKLMRSAGNKSFSLHECPRMSRTDQSLVECIPPGGNYRDVPDQLATPRIMKFKQTGGRTTTYGRLHPDRPAYTINTYFRRPNVGAHFHYAQSRLITAREAMRLQSFPDNFDLAKASQDKRNALIGNAVPPLMAQGVAWSLADGWGRDSAGQLVFDLA